MVHGEQDFIEDIGRDVVKIDQDRIKVDPVKPSELELSIRKDVLMNTITAGATPKGYEQGAVIGSWDIDEEEKAVKEYKALVEKVKQGQYTLNLYTDGKVYIKFH